MVLAFREKPNKQTKPELNSQAEAGNGTAEAVVSVRVKANEPDALRNEARPTM